MSATQGSILPVIYNRDTLFGGDVPRVIRRLETLLQSAMIAGSPAHRGRSVDHWYIAGS